MDGARALLVGVLLVGQAYAADEGPRLASSAGGVTLGSLPPILDDPEVRHELGSGLTNTFVLDVRARADRGHQATGAATIDIRYDLWDEVYRVAVATTTDGARRDSEVASYDELETWWSQLELPILLPVEAAVDQPWHATVELRLLPFSQTEQRDAEIWFSRSVERDQTLDPANRPPEEASTALGQGNALNLLVATSLRRSSVLSLRWQIEVVWEPDDASDD